MHRLPHRSSNGLTPLLVLAGLALATAAWACPDSKPTSHCPPNTDESATEASLVGPTPDPDADAPLLSGVSGPATRFRDGDSRLSDNPLSWLLTSGPMGGLKLATERLSRAPERRAGSISEATKAKGAVRRGGKSRSGGAVGHIAKPHRMPSLEIL